MSMLPVVVKLAANGDIWGYHTMYIYDSRTRSRAGINQCLKATH